MRDKRATIASQTQSNYIIEITDERESKVRMILKMKV